MKKYKAELTWTTHVVASSEEEAIEKAETVLKDWIRDGDLMAEWDITEEK